MNASASTKQQPTKVRLISIREACARTSLSRTSIWAKIKAGKFPRALLLGDDGKRKAFVEAEIEAWIDQQIAARDAIPA